MPAATKPSSGSVLSVRSKEMFIATAGPMAFENLFTPDEFKDPQTGAIKKTFSVTYHQGVPQVQRLGDLLDALVADLMAKFEEQAAKEDRDVPRGGWVPPTGADWIADHLKAAGEKSQNKDPLLKFANEAEYRDRDGNLQLKTMRGYDVNHREIDLPALQMGRGSIIQPVLMPGLYVTKVVKQPLLSFKLQGVVVLELKQRQFGPGGLSGGTREEDLSGVQAPSDLSAYAKGANTPAPAANAASTLDLDEEIPF